MSKPMAKRFLYIYGKREVYEDNDPAYYERLKHHACVIPQDVFANVEDYPTKIKVCNYCGVPHEHNRQTCSYCGAPYRVE